MSARNARDEHIQAIERPSPSLLTCYLLRALAVPPAFPVMAVVLYIRYRTLRYQFTDDGISMSWGVLFHRQILVNYARIQDIHLESNIVERWLGLSRILVQTASGNRAAEMTIEGITEFEALRDFLYARMRGVRDAGPATAAHAEGDDDWGTEVASALRETTAALRGVREHLARRER